MSGIDSLYLSFYGTLYKGRGNELFRLKELAKSQHQHDKGKAIYTHGHHCFAVRAWRRQLFPYVLDNPCYQICLSNSARKQVPMAYVQVKSEWLTHNGVQGVVDELMEIIERLATIESGPHVSRADLFVDAVTGLDFDTIKRTDWVTRARSIDDYGGAQNSTGFVFGRGGDLSARLYDKTIEILLSGKDYLKALWTRRGWNGTDSVHRLEAQFRSALLGQFGISTLIALQANCGALWRYFTQDWLKLTVPNSEDDTRARWPVHPVWRHLQQVPWQDVGRAVRINACPQNVPKDFLFANRAVSLVAGFMAAKHIDDPMEGFKQFYRFTKEYFDSNAWFEGADFAAILAEKIRLKCRDYGIGHPEAIRQRDEILEKDAADAYRKERDGE